ncbi:hypothetical protein Y1Q_0018557 [Alligator mississippiensis]|uniref:Uncharacterized protein n=1 Tax=Alligator mississippiensis TaxID=8496 RepID=A0A151PHJ4_ALLMI|nr:hypothetical protein Y1Q_0018557 [Alligator mississippiensis]
MSSGFTWSLLQGEEEPGSDFKGPAESNQGLLRAAFRPGGPRRLLSPSYTSAAGGSPGLGLPALASQLDYRLRAPTPGPP